MVDQAPNLAAAVTRLGRDPIDLILTEINLPDSAGTSTVGAMRAFAPGIPIIVLSHTDDVLAGKPSEGGDEYIVKGRFSIDSLVWLVRLVLERHGRPSADPPSRLIDPATGLATLPALQMAGQQSLLTAERAGLHAGIALVELKDAAPRRELADRELLLLTAATSSGRPSGGAIWYPGFPERSWPSSSSARAPWAPPSTGSPQRWPAPGLGPKVLVGFAAYDSDDRPTVDALVEEARSNASAVST